MILPSIKMHVDAQPDGDLPKATRVRHGIATVVVES